VVAVGQACSATLASSDYLFQIRRHDDDGLREKVRTVVGRFFVGRLETLCY
jgi:hypothetical protein